MVTRMIVSPIFDLPQTRTRKLSTRCITSRMSCAKVDSCCSAEEDILLPTSQESGPSPSQLLQEKSWTMRFLNTGQESSESSQERILQAPFTTSLRTTI